MSNFNHRGVFLQKLGPTPVDPDEVLVSMQFALKQSGWDAANAVPADSLLDSRIIIASSYDGGKTFDVRNDKDIDGDGDIDADDKEKLLALAKAYVSIMNP
ncbi:MULTISPECIES: hypothetical protein [unclassified Pseudomonas]|uniref:hypothetical protein n=1 Tax=unclassified Pseudomonas TaxID=196821 RepID=UPI000C81594A|nr:MULTISPECIES: hypothetical protein [unclassified Pseudomonas]MDX9672061.1 hypothetical protein [Pseudomonas sp. P8_250]PMQ12167.1 hypothetical protein PseAD21_09280 [Pseudomonas sp. AD21]WPN33980.1 hypothetical protein QMK53_17430 [Pseudomonas sp. P8_139]WPN44221.1 hypothetical protein QMK55_13945 [Pseudomonas sp. P8_229]